MLPVRTAEAPINIALIKYWGKRDAQLNIPTNDSISLTLESLPEESPASLPQPEGGETAMRLRTVTTVRFAAPCDPADAKDDDCLVLNGVASVPNSRIKRCLGYIRSIRTLPRVSIESWNQFPTAAGLASSASGYAALVRALSELVTPPLTEQEASIAARLGSGSACRSLPSGIVRWRAGDLPDGSDSLAATIWPVEHWPELRCLVVVLCGEAKGVSSAEGMHRTVLTSPLFPGRLQTLPYRIDLLGQALEERNFAVLAELVMRESNQLHALCLDSFPPIRYLDQRAYALIDAIHALNATQPRAAYTFDAGPNAFVLCEAPHVDRVRRTIEDALSSSGPLHIIVCRVGAGARIVHSE